MLFSSSQLEKKKFMWFSLLNLHSKNSSFWYELRGCSIDSAFICNDPFVTCPANGDATIEIKFALQFSKWRKMTRAQNHSIFSLEGPKQTTYNELKCCFFPLGCLCVRCLLCPECSLHLGCDGFTALVWSWVFTGWVKLYIYWLVDWFYWMHVSCMCAVHTDQDFWDFGCPKSLPLIASSLFLHLDKTSRQKILSLWGSSGRKWPKNQSNDQWIWAGWIFLLSFGLGKNWFWSEIFYLVWKGSILVFALKKIKRVIFFLKLKLVLMASKLHGLMNVILINFFYRAARYESLVAVSVELPFPGSLQRADGWLADLLNNK